MTIPTLPELPQALVELLDGERVHDKDNVAFVLATGEPEGWPHMALLSVGELIAVSPRELRLALHRGSGTTASLTRTGRGTLLIVHGGAAWTIRLAARRAADLSDTPVPLARFFVEVVEARRHAVPYAELTAPIGFRLLEPAATHQRWQATVAALREPQAGAECV